MWVARPALRTCTIFWAASLRSSSGIDFNLVLLMNRYQSRMIDLEIVFTWGLNRLEPNFPVDNFEWQFSGDERQQNLGIKRCFALKKSVSRSHVKAVFPARWLGCVYMSLHVNKTYMVKAGIHWIMADHGWICWMWLNHIQYRLYRCCLRSTRIEIAFGQSDHPRPCHRVGKQWCKTRMTRLADGKWWKYLFGILGSKSKTQRNTDEICTLASSCFWWPHLHYFLMCTSHLRSLQSDPGSSEAKKHTVRFFLHTLGQAFYPGVGLPASASSHCRIWQIWQNSNPRFECQNRFQHRWAIVRWGLLLHHLPNAWPPDSVAKTAKTGNLVCKIVRNCAVDQCMVWLDEPFPKLATTSRGAIRTWFGAMKDSVKPNIGGMVVLQNATKILYLMHSHTCTNKPPQYVLEL